MRFHAGTIEMRALDLASDLVKQGRISRAEADVIRELAKVAANRLSQADRAALGGMAASLEDSTERVTSSIAAIGTQERTG